MELSTAALTAQCINRTNSTRSQETQPQEHSTASTTTSQYLTALISYTNQAPSTADTSENMAPYTYAQKTSTYTTQLAQDNCQPQSDYIGFISLGYLQSYGNMIGLNIQFNVAAPPSGKTTSPLISYYGDQPQAHGATQIISNT